MAANEVAIIGNVIRMKEKTNVLRYVMLLWKLGCMVLIDWMTPDNWHECHEKHEKIGYFYWKLQNKIEIDFFFVACVSLRKHLLILRVFT